MSMSQKVRFAPIRGRLLSTLVPARLSADAAAGAGEKVRYVRVEKRNFPWIWRTHYKNLSYIVGYNYQAKKWNHSLTFIAHMYPGPRVNAV